MPPFFVYQEIILKGSIITDKEKYFIELARRLAAEGIDTERVTENSLVDKLPAVRIDAAGNPFRHINDPDTRSVGNLYHHSIFTEKMVAEYVEAVERSPPLVADGLTEDSSFYAR